MLIAHSLACLLVAEYCHRYDRNLAGVLLVAAPDPDSSCFPIQEAYEFVDFHRGQLPCPALLISSLDDPYASPEYSKQLALNWGSQHITVGRKGHINNVGDWPEGRNLLTAFRAGLHL